MTQTVSSKTTLLDAFLKQREKRQNDVGIQAQKLVNLYRHLALFGDDFLEKYNKMLLESSAEVQMSLNDIMGGTVVRQYLEFLKGKLKKADLSVATEEEIEPITYGYEQENTYLPSVDEVKPFHFDTALASPVNNSASTADSKILEQMIQVQTEYFEKALQKQTDFLNAALEKMQEQNKISESASSEAAQSSGARLDLVEFQKAQQALLERLIEKQNEQLNDSLKQVLENTQEISATQVAAFERLVQAQNDPVDKPYPIIEEYVPNNNFVPESIKNAPVPPRAYHPYEQENKQPLSVEMDLMGQDDMDEKNDAVSLHHKKPDEIKQQTPPLSQSQMPEGDVEILSEIDLSSEPL